MYKGLFVSYMYDFFLILIGKIVYILGKKSYSSKHGIFWEKRILFSFIYILLSSNYIH